MHTEVSLLPQVELVVCYQRSSPSRSEKVCIPMSLCYHKSNWPYVTKAVHLRDETK
jgi:hypothetical protein